MSPPLSEVPFLSGDCCRTRTAVAVRSYSIFIARISHLLDCELRCDDEPIFVRNFNYIDRVDVFLLRRDLQLAEGGGDAGNRNLLFPAALVVSPNGITQRSFEEIDYHAKSRCAGRCNVSRSIAWQRIRVVDHKRLPALHAGGQEKLFPLPRSQHIQADANVTSEENARDRKMSFLSLERQQKSPLPLAH